MKKLLICICTGIILGSSVNIYPPTEANQYQKNTYCSRINYGYNKLFNFIESFNKPIGKSPIIENYENQYRPDYTIEYLNTLSYSELIDLLVTIEWYDIDGLWNYREGTYEFYADENRVLSLINAIEERGQLYTPDDDFGIPTLVEVTRAGFYHSFYHPDELGYLSEDSFKENLIPSMLSISFNPNFGFGTTETQLNISHAYGAYISIGYANVEIINRTSQLFEEFYENYDNWVTQYDYTNAIWWIGEGVRYTLYRHDYAYNDITDSEYFGQINPVFEEISALSLLWELELENEWLFENFTYWVGYYGMFVDSDQPVNILTQIIELYGEWTLPTIWAYYMLDWLYNSTDYYGDTFDLDDIYNLLRNWLLPDSYNFDDGTYKFSVGANVTIEKVNLLYWASKEVKSQFHRISLRDIPQEVGNEDDTLNVIIYNSPREYKFNRFLYNLNTNNGGIYIESWGTFFTYERTSQESIYTLEELFRHEYTHYLQGRYLVPGLWGQHPIYNNERLTWYEEGQAELLSGSSRLQGVLPRKSIVGSISNNSEDWMDLNEVLIATYSSGFTFYKYAFAFWDFIWNDDLELMVSFNQAVINGDGTTFDNLVSSIIIDSDLNEQYHSHISYLKEHYDELVDPTTSNLYLYDFQNITDDNIQFDLNNLIEWENVITDSVISEYHNLLMVNGTLNVDLSGNISDDYIILNELINSNLITISDYEWHGYLTTNGYFTIDNENNYQINFLLKKDNEENSWGFSNPGCSDPLACNYDEYVTEDDGSCEYPQESWIGISCNFVLIPEEFSTIQEGINASIDGDSILVSVGIYYENISFNGKNISLIGENRETTIIDGNQEGIVVSFTNGEGSSSKLERFTIINALSDDGYGGGGIKCFGSSPILENLIIKNNYSYRGAGIGCSNGANPILRNVLITGNTSSESGGAIYIANNSNPILENITITNNSCSYGAIHLVASNANLTNVIVWDNPSPYGIYLWASSEIEIQYSDINNIGFGGDSGNEEWDIAGNISVDPLFTNPEYDDFTLQPGSPCIDVGDPDSPLDPDGTIADMGAYYYHQESGVPTEIIIDYQSGWNLVGLPLDVDYPYYITIFPDATENTLYSFGETYVPDSTLIQGEGYWLRFDNSGTTTITGTPIDELTISLSEGWNLVSGLHEDLSIYSINDPDSTIVPNTLFGFSDAYFLTEELVPGNGYWLRAYQDGEVTVTGGGLARVTPKDFNLNDRANTLTVNGIDLYFGIEMSARERLSYSLPPKPPSGAYDVRFKDGWRAVKDYGEIEVLNHSETLTIEYDIKVDAGEHYNWVLSSETLYDYVLENAGELTVPSAERFTLELKAVVPATFTLHQNFPNPFNPITTLRYDLPSDALITLSIYDMLGREITQLVNTTQEAGFRSVQWDATDSMGRPVSAGVYLYQIRDGEFVQTKKMVLLK